MLIQDIDRSMLFWLRWRDLTPVLFELSPLSCVTILLYINFCLKFIYMFVPFLIKITNHELHNQFRAKKETARQHKQSLLERKQKNESIPEKKMISSFPKTKNQNHTVIIFNCMVYCTYFMYIFQYQYPRPLYHFPIFLTMCRCDMSAKLVMI